MKRVIRATPTEGRGKKRETINQKRKSACVGGSWGCRTLARYHLLHLGEPEGEATRGKKQVHIVREGLSHPGKGKTETRSLRDSGGKKP